MRNSNPTAPPDRGGGDLDAADVAESLAEIANCIQPENWNADAHSPVRASTVQQAQLLLRSIAEEASRRRVAWVSPSVGATVDADIDLSWENCPRWVVLTVRGGETAIGCARQEGRQPPSYQLESQGDAINAALGAMFGG